MTSCCLLLLRAGHVSGSARHSGGLQGWTTGLWWTKTIWDKMKKLVCHWGSHSHWGLTSDEAEPRKTIFDGVVEHPTELLVSLEHGQGWALKTELGETLDYSCLWKVRSSFHPPVPHLTDLAVFRDFCGHWKVLVTQGIVHLWKGPDYMACTAKPTQGQPLPCHSPSCLQPLHLPRALFTNLWVSKMGGWRWSNKWQGKRDWILRGVPRTTSVGSQSSKWACSCYSGQGSAGS